MIGRSGERGSGISVLAAWHGDDDDIFILYSLVLCSCLLMVPLLYLFFPENVSLFPLISWFVLYLILQAFTNQNAAVWIHLFSTITRLWVYSGEGSSLNLWLGNHSRRRKILNSNQLCSALKLSLCHILNVTEECVNTHTHTHTHTHIPPNTHIYMYIYS